MKEKRDEIIILRLTKTEKNRIYEKMLGMGIRSLSAYIRKMALDGYCLNLDLPQLRRMAYLLQMCSNNLNQYAKRANESGKISVSYTHLNHYQPLSGSRWQTGTC